MPAEKQNNISSRLDGLDRVPESFVFDQGSGWLRFEKELLSKKASRKRPWLMAAALVPVFAISYFFPRPVDKPPVDGTAIKVSMVEMAAADQITPNKTIASREKEEVVSKKKPVVSTNKSPGPEATDTFNLVVVVDTNETIEPVKEITPITAGLPPKPKFRIAHINEINSEPAVSPGLMTSPQIKKPFLATVTTSPTGDIDKIAQKKKYPLSFLSNPMQ